MPRSERERREDLAHTTERAAPALEVVAPVPAAALRMQATIGNRATAGVLARAPETKAPARGSTVSVARLGDYKLYSFSRAGDSTVSVTLDAAGHEAKFFAAAAQGAPIATVTISHSGHTITLSKVILASVQSAGDEQTGPVLAVEFNAGAIDFD